jgi:predicted CXXCH cytochrome family protein
MRVLGAVLGLALVPTLALGQVVGTKHDLRTFNGGTGTQTCSYCHAPHGASANVPLWNHTMTTATFTIYNSATRVMTIGQPGPVSLACLSCHDGTVAAANGHSLIAGDTGFVGTDLSNDHPVGVTYNPTLNPTSYVALATARNTVPFYGAGRDQVECASCHNPHSNTNGHFVRMSNTASALCTTCHVR